MGFSRAMYVIIVAAVVAAVAALYYLAPRPAHVDLGTVIATPKPSAPPLDKVVLLRRAIAGDSDAQCRLAGRFQTGDGLPYNPPLAYYWAESSASKHDPCGINNLANLYANGSFVAQDQQLAIHLYELAASMGDLNAMANLGRAYYNGYGVQKNVLTALDWYKRAADRGDFTSMRRLGEIYGWGEGVPLNIDRSSAYLLRANPVHDGPAAYDLGWLYYRYYPRKERCERAVHWLTISADLDDPDGETMLGVLEETGTCGVKKSAAEAARLYRKAMDRSPTAEENYAAMLWTGEPGASDRPLALRYARDAAAAGNAQAMYLLGAAYDRGTAVMPDPKTAWFYFSESAERGNPAAVSVVASAYFYGHGVKQDKVRGLGMMLAAESLGNYLNPRDKARWSKQLTQSGIAAAHRFAFAFAARVKETTDAYGWLAPPVATDARVD